jgi:hypothetical protein
VVKPEIQALLDLISANLEDDPEAITYLRRVFEALDRCSIAVDKVKPGSDDAPAALANLTFSLLLELGEAGDDSGRSPTSAEARASIIKLLEARIPRELELGHKRAIRAAVYRKHGYGIRDNENLPRFHDQVLMEEAMAAIAFEEGLEGFDAAQSVRKSISRFRRKFRSQRLHKFDPEAVTLKSVEAESVLFEGLPMRSGRPRRG